jgi:NADPH2:quinone reductase
LRGARVITTVSSREKAAFAREAGADDTVLYTEEDLVERVRALTNGTGVHVRAARVHASAPHMRACW